MLFRRHCLDFFLYNVVQSLSDNIAQSFDFCVMLYQELKAAIDRKIGVLEILKNQNLSKILEKPFFISFVFRLQVLPVYQFAVQIQVLCCKMNSFTGKPLNCHGPAVCHTVSLPFSRSHDRFFISHGFTNLKWIFCQTHSFLQKQTRQHNSLSNSSACKKLNQ